MGIATLCIGGAWSVGREIDFKPQKHPGFFPERCALLDSASPTEAGASTTSTESRGRLIANTPAFLPTLHICGNDCCFGPNVQDL